MFEKIVDHGIHKIISNALYEVKITPKIYSGYTLTKSLKNNPLEIIEVRDIRLPLSEKEILKEARSLLKQMYTSVSLPHYSTQNS